jgi:hypothetical protein
VNLGELRTAVANRAGVRSTDPSYDAIDDRINEALHSIETAMGGQWDWLYAESEVATTVDTETVTFDALAAGVTPTAEGIRRIRFVEYEYGDSWATIERETLQTARLYYQGVSNGSVLARWAVEGLKLHVFPLPSAAINLRVGVILMEPDLSDDTDSPLMPATYHRILVAAAAGLVLRSSQRFSEAQVEEASAMAGMNQMLAASTPYTGSGRITRTR